jgi:quinol monooxygenase YgiN
MIIVHGSVTARPGQLTQALALSQEHVDRSRAEPGCISHAVYRDPEDDDRLVFVECWTDAAALQKHFQLAESRAFVKAVGALAAGRPEMTVYEAQEKNI